MAGKTTREDVLSALREKAQGLTRLELHARFPNLGDDRLETFLRSLYDDRMVGLDVVSDPRVARWTA
ncbi:hypothetical protein NC315_13540 [Streptomyces sp. G2]|uniref:hypothetical protein n=1 Tax=Streptomyces sp. G2 TaxID=1684471 RepID=UPI002030153A|nr:hypothetical protein [Streptomyces sp. G2]MCM1946393.1 hypothetical protein [Streptomyces sp. G2]